MVEKFNYITWLLWFTGIDYLHYFLVHRFGVVGYGCMTCIGNSGPLADPVAEAIDKVNI